MGSALPHLASARAWDVEHECGIWDAGSSHNLSLQDV